MSEFSQHSPLGLYSRENPSARYRELLEQYRMMHRDGIESLGISPVETFDGGSMLYQAERIRKLIQLTASKSILDYGSGKGMQYCRSLKNDKGESWDSIQDFWNVDEIHCYDPAVPDFEEMPENQFDGVICTDVLEHCPAEDVPWIIEELFSHATRFLYANVACYSAKKQLPNGENAHCTVMPNEWWKSIILSVVHSYPSLKFEFCFTSPIPDKEDYREEERFGNVREAA